ncbi:MAG: hypothetical protein HY721_19735 [Planctomycetes bacterium]|nr:hypothetical protein [Planctomycetota bacterium]
MSEVLRPLVGAARRGDAAAINSLASCVDRFVRVHSGSLSRQLRRTRGSTVDFVLEGLAEALARLPDFEYRSDEGFYAWVSRCIRNRIADAGREEAAAKLAVRPKELGGDDEGPAAPGPTPSSVVSAEEFRSAVGTVLLELQVERPREMEVVVMKLFDGLSWPEIRERLGLATEKKARVLFARGLDLLRPRVKEAIGDAAVKDLLGLP